MISPCICSNEVPYVLLQRVLLLRLVRPLPLDEGFHEGIRMNLRPIGEHHALRGNTLWCSGKSAVCRPLKRTVMSARQAQFLAAKILRRQPPGMQISGDLFVPWTPVCASPFVQVLGSVNDEHGSEFHGVSAKSGFLIPSHFCSVDRFQI